MRDFKVGDKVKLNFKYIKEKYIGSQFFEEVKKYENKIFLIKEIKIGKPFPITITLASSTAVVGLAEIHFLMGFRKEEIVLVENQILFDFE